MECVCEFKLWNRNQRCNVYGVNITEPGIKLTNQEKHTDGHSNIFVAELDIADQIIEYMPAGLGEMFPNLKRLTLWACELKRLTRNDLIGMPNLEGIYISDNPIKYIPGDLFEDTKNLKAIFIGTEIQFIEEGLINGLDELEYLRIDGCNFNILSDSVKKDFTRIQKELQRCEPNDEERKKYEIEGKRLEEIVEKRSTSVIKKSERKFKAFKSLLESGRYSDIEIMIEGEKFNVHKLVIGAHSSVLADIFENHEDVKELNLKEIKKETFKSILNFIYKEELPASDANYLDLYSACGQLKIVELMQICEERIKVEKENVAQVVTAAKKFGSEKLKDESLEVVQKMYSDCNISKKLIENPEELNKILETLEILKKYSS